MEGSEKRFRKGSRTAKEKSKEDSKEGFEQGPVKGSIKGFGMGVRCSLRRGAACLLPTPPSSLVSVWRCF